MREKDDYGPEDYEAYEPPDRDIPIYGPNDPDYEWLYINNSHDPDNDESARLLAEEHDRLEIEREAEEEFRRRHENASRDKMIASVILVPIGIYFIFKFLALIL
ncbi:hypothetical protein HLB35_15835 [Halomonas sp. TBZ9]|uniref:Uncharacterized protein n=1 Tax=Vreelandella azerica TaxID=2732867 RepID=A0A7Y3XC28_9GAMM|nr:hypothetical protein [Halomonas azerica]NOG32865.1 hypothetical protein [Halomonas azerica]